MFLSFIFSAFDTMDVEEENRTSDVVASFVVQNSAPQDGQFLPPTVYSQMVLPPVGVKVLDVCNSNAMALIECRFNFARLNSS